LERISEQAQDQKSATVWVLVRGRGSEAEREFEGMGGALNSGAELSSL